METTIVFRGICTFVEHRHVGIDGDGMRVIMVNARSSPAPGGVRVPPHFATITANGPDGKPLVPAAALHGVALHLRGDAGSVVKDTTFKQLVPNLTSLNDQVQPLGPPSPLITMGAVPDLVAAYFDIRHGTLSASLSNEDLPPVFSTLVAVSENHPEETEHILEMTPFLGAAKTEFPDTLTLPPGSTVTINNTSLDKIDRSMPSVDTLANHFLLHYLVATQFPPAAQLPPVPQKAGDGHMTPGSMGCSNSTYP